jgi:hypothetical protein
MSLSCALWATSLQQWARRYIRLTQPPRCSPEKRARMRAFFANGVDKMHVPWAVEGLPTLLHLSLFLFFGGLVIFLFSVDQEVFTRVVWWIVLFSIVYGLITLLPLIWHDSPYSTPLSTPAWFLYAMIQYVALSVFVLCRNRYWRYRRRQSYWSWRYYLRFSRWMLGGVEKKAEKTAEEQSSEIDIRILGWTISALGDDDSLERFFEAIPGFFNSKLVEDLESDLPLTHLETFWRALDGFMGRTSSSNLVTEFVKSRRDTICKNVINMILPRPQNFMHDNLRCYFDQATVSIERLQATMARWRAHKDDRIVNSVRVWVAKNLASMQECNDAWIAFASEVSGLAAHDLQENIAHGGDNVLLATLIDVSRRATHSPSLRFNWPVMVPLTQFNIHHTLPALQHSFCILWNESVQEARKHGSRSTPNKILSLISHLHISLHQSNDASPALLSVSADGPSLTLGPPSLHLLCDIVGHRPDLTSHVPVPNFRAVPLPAQPGHLHDAPPHHTTSGVGTVPGQVKDASIIPGPTLLSETMTPSEIGDNSRGPAATEPALQVHTSPRLTDASPPIPAALQDIPPAVHPLEGSTQRGIAAPCAEPDIGEILSTASTPAPTPTLAPVPDSTPPVLDESSTSCDPDTASTTNPLLPASSVVGFSVPASHLSPVPPLPKIPSHPTGTTTLPRLRARGLANSGNMCLVNAVLHLLVHSLPFWDLFRELGDLKGQRGAGGPETGGGASPLVDAMARFFDEFTFKEEEPPTPQQPLQLAARGKQGQDEEVKEVSKVVDSFEPTYMYDAMKEKRQLKGLLVCPCIQNALFCY